MKIGWSIGTIFGFILFLVLGINGIGNIYYTIPIGVVLIGLIGHLIDKAINKKRSRKSGW